jgi:signal peptide peptidase SppA
MKIYPHLFAKLFAQPVLVLPAVRDHLERELLGRMGVTTPKPKAYDDYDDGPAKAPETRAESTQRRMNAIMETYGSVAVIRIEGVIDKAMSDAELDCYGGCDLNDVCNAISEIQGNALIDTVVFYFNTPGGSAIGVAETAERIAALRDDYEVHAFFDVQCCSAGMWLASQADWVACLPSAIGGSIGVYMALLDQTKALEMDGLKVNLIKSGRLKAMGASFKELTDEERSLLQKQCDDLYAEFKTAVTSVRSVGPEAMQGQSMSGKDALAANLVDEVCNCTLDEYVAGLMTR